MNKTLFGTELKNKLLKGIETVNSSVSSTLGPSGRNVLYTNAEGKLNITKDGVTVAKQFDKLEDPYENYGAQLLKEVSQKAVDKAGDGTTTATLLTTTMIQEGMKLIQNGSNVVDVKNGIDLSVKAVVNKLKEISVDIISNDQLKQVATLSGNNDPEVGELIATALDKVGEDGVVAIEESKTGETRLEVVEGMMFERGFKSPYFATNQASMEAVLEKPLILLFDGKITQANQLLNVLNFVAAQSRSLLIVAEDIEHEALALLIVNKSRGIVKVCAVKAPDYGDRRTHLLEDMAVLTGGVVLSPTKGNKLDKIASGDYKNYLGEARLSTITTKDTTIVDGKSKMVETGEFELDDATNTQVPILEPALDKRLREIKEQFDSPKLSAFEKENLQSRISKLTGGVAIIEVGGLSEVEMKEKKDRIDDALHATKAAWEQGIVPGGGMALINCESALNELVLPNRDQELGREIVRKALYAPFTKILTNAGIENTYEILSKVRNNQTPFGKDEPHNNSWSGYNVKTGEYGSLKTMGVVDPTKVTRTALENAASVAGIVLTTESAIITLEENGVGEQIDPNMFEGM